LNWKRWAKRAAALLLAAALFFVFGWVPWFLGGVATTRRFQFPDRENAGLTPASFDLAHEELRFQAPDGVGLSGWWVPVDAPRGSVILVHGLNRSRIEMVKKLPFLHAQGWNALLFDLRHHGDSDGSVSSFGHFEKQDVLAAVAQARERSPGPVVLWGVSLGGATATLAAAEDATIAGLICDSSYSSLRDTVTHHVGLARSWRWWLRLVPQWPVADEVVFWIGRRGHFDPDAVDVERAAEALRGRPVLFVANSGDRRIPQEVAFALQAAAGGTAQVLIVPGDSHGGAYRDGKQAYEHAAMQVLDVAAPRPEDVPLEVAS
jgi:pimeloyl-ACP methyl ester carboxylesterase